MNTNKHLEFEEDRATVSTNELKTLSKYSVR